MPTPRRRQLGTRGLSRSGRCDRRERASRAGLTRGRGPPAAGAGAGGCGGLRAEAGSRGPPKRERLVGWSCTSRRPPPRPAARFQRWSEGREAPSPTPAASPSPRLPSRRRGRSVGAEQPGRGRRRGERAARETRPPPSPRAAERRQWPCGAGWEGGRVGPGGGEVVHTCAPGLAEAAGSGQR